VVPLTCGVGQTMELGAAMGETRPDVRDRPAELGVPQQRWEIVEGEHHADVVDRAVGEGPDGSICGRLPPEQPHVACPCEPCCFVEGHHRVLGVAHRGPIVRSMGLWKWVGLAGIVGVAAVGTAAGAASVKRKRREFVEANSDELRNRLHERLREAEARHAA
jgi:hypothetical protein